jgi:hypothetical protein
MTSFNFDKSPTAHVDALRAICHRSPAAHHRAGGAIGARYGTSRCSVDFRGGDR